MGFAYIIAALTLIVFGLVIASTGPRSRPAHKIMQLDTLAGRQRPPYCRGCYNSGIVGPLTYHVPQPVVVPQHCACEYGRAAFSRTA